MNDTYKLHFIQPYLELAFIVFYKSALILEGEKKI